MEAPGLGDPGLSTKVRREIELEHWAQRRLRRLVCLPVGRCVKLLRELKGAAASVVVAKGDGYAPLVHALGATLVGELVVRAL